MRNGGVGVVPVMSGAPAGLRYPDFLCIGVQKSATTWLDSNLRRIPALWLPPMKELQYFSQLYNPRTKIWAPGQRRARMEPALERYRKNTPPAEWDDRYLALLTDIMEGQLSDEWYGRIFGHAPPDKLCGEVTPDYAVMPRQGIDHVFALAPEVRIILSLRDPIERCWSQIRMFTRKRKITELSDLERLANHQQLVARTNYPAIIGRWRTLVPEERFHVFFMDEVAADPARVLEEVCRFLERDCPKNVLEKAAQAVHVGAAKEIPAPVLDILKRRLQSVYQEFAVLYPDVGARWASRYY